MLWVFIRHDFGSFTILEWTKNPHKGLFITARFTKVKEFDYKNVIATYKLRMYLSNFFPARSSFTKISNMAASADTAGIYDIHRPMNSQAG